MYFRKIGSLIIIIIIKKKEKGQMLHPYPYTSFADITNRKLPNKAMVLSCF